MLYAAHVEVDELSLDEGDLARWWAFLATKVRSLEGIPEGHPHMQIQRIDYLVYVNDGEIELDGELVPDWRPKWVPAGEHTTVRLTLEWGWF